MTKNFARAPRPQPSPEAISAFERGGSGQDHIRNHIPPNVETREPANVDKQASDKPQTRTATEDSIVTALPETSGESGKEGTHISPKAGKREAAEAAQEPTRRLSVDLPRSWHRRFKTACSETDRKMLAEVMAFIKSRTVELENEARDLRKTRGEVS